MDYSLPQFTRLTEAIEAEGGMLLDRLCEMREYIFSGPVGKRPGKVTRLPGCGNTSIFEIPYEGEDGKGHPVELCAVCDDLGNKPRWAHTMRAT